MCNRFPQNWAAWNKQASSAFLWIRNWAWLSLVVLTHLTGVCNQGAGQDAVTSRLNVGTGTSKFTHVELPASPQSFLLVFPQRVEEAWQKPQAFCHIILEKTSHHFSHVLFIRSPYVQPVFMGAAYTGAGAGLENVGRLTDCKNRVVGKELVKGLNIQRALKFNKNN